MDGLRTALARVKSETAPEEAYSQVRRRVIREIERRRRFRWVWPVALAAAAALIAFWAVETRPARIAAPPVIARLPTVPELPHAAAVRRRSKKRAAGSDEPLVVRMVTDDPEVVIYWITQGNGE